MSAGRTIMAMLLADFRERTRRTSFVLTVCMVIYLGYSVSAGQILVQLEGYRGIYNSAWVGSLMSVVITFFLGLVGFYLVKDAVQRDERTGVGQIIATTPITRVQYLLGKWLSNFSLLAALVGILSIAAIVMQLLYREDPVLNLWALLAPLMFIALPMMALVAALAVLFECVPLLKGGFGNLVYFGVFNAIFVAGIMLPELPWLDVTGFSLLSASMRTALVQVFPEYTGGFVLAFISDKPLNTFLWQGIPWTLLLIAQRLAWLPVSVALVGVGALFFHRFDPVQRRLAKDARMQAAPVGEETQPAGAADHAVAVEVRLTPLATTGFRMNVLRLAWLEGRLFVKGLKWYWLAGAAILWLGCALTPTEAVRKFWYMLAALAPVLIWAHMGVRENEYGTGQLIHHAPHPLLRPLAASWLAGVAMAALITSGVLVGRLAAGEPLHLTAWALAVVFIPSLALALGVVLRTSKAFEVVYPILWYLGPFNRDSGLLPLDYLGVHPGAPVHTAPLWVAAAVVLMLVVAVTVRARQLSAGQVL